MLQKTKLASRLIGSPAALIGLILMPIVAGQDRDRDRDRDHDRDNHALTRVEPGTVIPIRINETIDVERRDNRIYTGTVDQDVRGENGRIAVLRGARVELIVRQRPDNDLVLDLESIFVSGQRYAVKTEPNRVESQRDNSLVGSIVGAISGDHDRGRPVRIPRDSVVTFRLERPLDVGVEDRGVTRDGRHYHDYRDERQ